MEILCIARTMVTNKIETFEKPLKRKKKKKKKKNQGIQFLIVLYPLVTR